MSVALYTETGAQLINQAPLDYNRLTKCSAKSQAHLCFPKKTSKMQIFHLQDHLQYQFQAE